MERAEVERVVAADWENGYVECSAMFNSNISAVFRALLHQARCNIYAVSTIYLHSIYTLYPHCISPAPHLDDHGLHLLAVPPHLALPAPPPLLLHTRPRPGPALAQPPPRAAAGGRGGAVLVQLEHKQQTIHRQIQIIRSRGGLPALTLYIAMLKIIELRNRDHDSGSSEWRVVT